MWTAVLKAGGSVAVMKQLSWGVACESGAEKRRRDKVPDPFQTETVERFRLTPDISYAGQAYKNRIRISVWQLIRCVWVGQLQECGRFAAKLERRFIRQCRTVRNDNKAHLKSSSATAVASLFSSPLRDLCSRLAVQTLQPVKKLGWPNDLTSLLFAEHGQKELSWHVCNILPALNPWSTAPMNAGDKSEHGKTT